MHPFLEGLLAGYGIAVPVGAIAVLIIETGLRYGFASGFIAGAGAATADLVYAALAALTGTFLAYLLAPFETHIRVLSSIVLIGLGLFGMARTLREVSLQQRFERKEGMIRLYAQFLALTLINPLTVVYFSALIVGGVLGVDSSNIERTMFVVGAGIASLSWQSVLAVVGAFFRKSLPRRAQRGLSALGNLVILLLGLRILLRL